MKKVTPEECDDLGATIFIKLGIPAPGQGTIDEMDVIIESLGEAIVECAGKIVEPLLTNIRDDLASLVDMWNAQKKLLAEEHNQ